LYIIQLDRDKPINALNIIHDVYRCREYCKDDLAELGFSPGLCNKWVAGEMSHAFTESEVPGTDGEDRKVCRKEQ